MNTINIDHLLTLPRGRALGGQEICQLNRFWGWLEGRSGRKIRLAWKSNYIKHLLNLLYLTPNNIFVLEQSAIRAYVIRNFYQSALGSRLRETAQPIWRFAIPFEVLCVRVHLWQQITPQTWVREWANSALATLSWRLIHLIHAHLSHKHILTTAVCCRRETNTARAHSLTARVLLPQSVHTLRLLPPSGR